MSYWIKAYTEILNDPKIGRLPLAMRWRFMEACLLVGAITPANEIGDGYLPPIEDAAFMAHANPDELLEDWRKLERSGLLAETPDGWLVVNFAKRQAPSEGAERVRLHRERAKLLQERYSNLHDTTPESDTESDTDTDTELIKRESTPPDQFQAVKTLVEKHTGMPSMPRDVPALQELAGMDDLQEADIVGAIAWHKEQGRVVYGASHLLGAIKHNRAMRIQSRANAPPGRNGKPGKRTVSAIDAERERLRQEEAARDGNQ